MAAIACGAVFAQSPQYIPYQAVARNAAGNLLVNQNISLRFTIHESSGSGSVDYQETQSATTNNLGLFSVNIGNGMPVSGTLSGIPWANGVSKYTQVEIDPTGGSSYTNMGSSQMMSVPYALYAGSAPASVTSPVSGNGTAGSPLAVGYDNSTIKVNGSNQLYVASAPSGSTNYIQNGASTQSAANFNIQSAAAGSVGGVIKGAGSQTADLLDLDNSSGTVLAKIDASGDLSVTGTENVTGLVTDNGGFTETGAVNINTSANNAVNINTGTSTGTITLGGADNNVNVPKLATNSAVYTDGSSNLTTTIPSSGALGYWTLSGTSLRPTTTGNSVGIGTALTGRAKFTTFAGGATATTYNDIAILGGTGAGGMVNGEQHLVQWTDGSGTISGIMGGYNGGTGFLQLGYFYNTQNNSVNYGSQPFVTITGSNTTGVNGLMGIGTITPATIVDVLSGNNWGLTTGNGDIRLGATVSSIPYYLKIGIATGGAGAGDAYISSTGGGTSRLYLGTVTASQTSGVGYSQTLTLQNGNVGIGAISPLTTEEIFATSPELRILEGTGTNLAQIELGDGINDPGNTVEGLRIIYNSNTGNSYLENIYASGTLNFQTNGANTRMTIDQNGYVGIGAAPSSSYQLYVNSAATYGVYSATTSGTGVYGSGSTYGVYGLGGSGEYGVAGICPGTDGWGIYGSSNLGYGGYFNGGSYGVFAEATASSATNYGIYATASGGTTNWAGYFAGNVDITGNVGIGAASPNAPLEISNTGDIAFLDLNTTSTTNKRTRIDFSQNGTDLMEIGTDVSVNNTSDMYFYNRATGVIAGYIYPGNDIWWSPRGTSSDFYMNSSGFVGIGSTTPYAPLWISAASSGAVSYLDASCNAGLTIAGTPSLVRLQMGVSGSTYNYSSWIQSSYDNSASSNGTEALLLNPRGGFVGIATGTTAPAYPLTVNGQPAANGYTAFTNYSDRRLKDNIAPVGNCLDKIMQLNPVQYNYNSEYAAIYNDTTATTRVHRGFIAQEVKEVFPEMVGNSRVNGKDYYDLNLSNLPVYMVKAMQQQQQQIEELKKQNGSLTEQNQNLQISNQSTNEKYNQLKAQVDKLQELMMKNGIRSEK